MKNPYGKTLEEVWHDPEVIAKPTYKTQTPGYRVYYPGQAPHYKLEPGQKNPYGESMEPLWSHTKLLKKPGAITKPDFPENW